MYQGTNMADLFTKFKQAVPRITTSHLFFIELFVHELLALSNILLLRKGQYSLLWIDTFAKELLDDLNTYFLTECMDFTVDINDDACI
ncbi:hypothetical protein CLU79DRAFT_692266 [Phycomyces nitens]|nr:hypothetical protein CLU79DRAFT_692266 [Phycomyces nitens]